MSLPIVGPLITFSRSTLTMMDDLQHDIFIWLFDPIDPIYVFAINYGIAATLLIIFLLIQLKKK